jgi:hypothetical protein
MAVDHERIRRLLGDEEESSDTSLRAKSLARALEETVPTTLTPHEWEQWYAEHGVPDSHNNAKTAHALPWWRRWLRTNRQP